ncbi:MAG TPA: helix-turn-helix domain-containing protein [Mycobacteriales bacterium]|nr:helix-turn-helix domain-containing protein [Mycobacteriales bacterium]
MAKAVVEVSDPRALRAMAHPVRGRLFYELVARGTARAADLARDLDVPANQVSFHLRQMAKYGFIEEAPEHARDRRDRVWRPASEMGFDIDSGLTDNPAFQQASRRHAHEVLDTFLSGDGKDFRRSHDISMRLTETEAEQMADEVQDLLLRWTERGKNRRDDPDEPRQTYLTMVYIQPQP